MTPMGRRRLAVMTSGLALMLAGGGHARLVEARQAPAPITYRVTFPEPEHHWLQVELTATDLGTMPFLARMSRASPGRYATHEFAKNVFLAEAFDGKGQPLTLTRSDVDEWRVPAHDGTVRLVYRIFGDHADGTYMGVDTTHAHLNMPATFMWTVSQDARPIRIVFVPPASSNWTVATQLFTTSDPFTFTAPNLQYFMDSPTELAALITSRFTVPTTNGPPAMFRIAAHTDATQADVDALAAMVQRLVREHITVFGELPVFEPGAYTFLLDFSSWGDGDGMEHRNSTTISVPGLSIRTRQGREEALDPIAHEFFHTWNVERIRPVGLEPFDFTRPNITCCLWLAEGFTQYYGELLLLRSGLVPSATPPFSNVLALMNSSGRLVRSAVQMSEYAPFSDAATSIDLTDANRTFLSYYTHGAAVAMALDLSLRDLTASRVTLDDFMRALWVRHGKPGGAAPGLVARPYTLQDLRVVLAEVAGNAAFANAFFDRYVEGREVADYATLLGKAGYVVRPVRPDAGWIGNVPVRESVAGLLVGTDGRGESLPVPFNTPLYEAGVDEGDTIVTINAQPATQAGWSAIARGRPGDVVTLGVRRRDGKVVTLKTTLKADPAKQVVAVETQPGASLTAAQKAFRDAWLGTRVR